MPISFEDADSDAGSVTTAGSGSGCCGCCGAVGKKRTTCGCHSQSANRHTCLNSAPDSAASSSSAPKKKKKKQQHKQAASAAAAATDESANEGDEWQEHTGDSPPAKSASSKSVDKPAGAAAWSYFQTEAGQRLMQKAYDEYLGQPYRASLRQWANEDWDLKIKNGTYVQRPNHGLAHSVRVAHALPVALHLLLQHAGMDSASVSLADVWMAQYCLLFLVAGRGNEIGWVTACALEKKLGRNLHADFHHASKQALLDTLKQADHAPPVRVRTQKQRDQWADMLDIGGAVVEEDPLSLAMQVCHEADLMRCWDKQDFTSKMREFDSRLGKAGVRTFVKYMRDLNEATGDRYLAADASKQREYERPLFWQCSTDVRSLADALASVKLPVELCFAAKSKAAPSSASAVDSGDDTDSDSSTVGMRKLIGKFGKLAVHDDDDEYRYSQLQLEATSRLAFYRQTSSCVPHFYRTFELDHDIVANMYTQKKLFRALNLELCRESAVDYVKMYTLLLSRAMYHIKADESS